MTTKTFASAADLEVKKVSFDKLSDHAYAYTAEGDPNTGIIIGDDAVMVIDTQATPVMAQDVIRRIREVTDKPIKYVLLSHYHAVRVLGASAYGGLTWPTMTFNRKMTLWLGKLEVQILQLGRGHTKGDTVAWLPQEKILFSGDLVEFDATPYAGDAYFKDWPQTLDNLAALKPEKLVPGRGAALQTPEQVQAGLAGTRAFISDLYESVKESAAKGEDLRKVYEATFAKLQPKYGNWVIFNHCMPFDVTRAYDEATQYPDPRIWTAERDVQMWKALEG
jgi:glyoxylase-like metal-dependent hydrolase (beta-lactamase superfamily II)